MRGIFISYRRTDTAGEARALYKDLVASLGENAVFMDVDSIALGRDFREALHERLESCDVVLVLIGDEWLDTADESGKRRLEDPNDVVRQEIDAALKRNIPVTPVLLQGVKMPTAKELPEDIESLAYRNGFEIRHRQWESDVQDMIERLGLVEKRHEPVSSQSKSRIWGVAGLVASLVLLSLLVFFAPWDNKTGGMGLPAYVVVDSAWKTKLQARARVAELSTTYKKSGFLWIPDFDSLSGAQLFQVYVGPFKSREKAQRAVCDYITRFNKKKSEHYGVLVSKDTTRQDRFFCKQA